MYAPRPSATSLSFPHVATSATMLAFQAPPLAVTAPVTQNGKIAGMMNLRHHCVPRRPKIRAGLLEVRGDRHRPCDHVEKDIPLRAERHQQDAAEVDRNVRGDEKRDDERERHVDRERRRDLRQRLRNPRHARSHSDPDADRRPDERREDRHRDDAQSGSARRARRCAAFAPPTARCGSRVRSRRRRARPIPPRARRAPSRRYGRAASSAPGSAAPACAAVSATATEARCDARASSVAACPDSRSTR